MNFLRIYQSICSYNLYIFIGLLFILVDVGYCVATAFGSDSYSLIGPSIGVAVFSAVSFGLPIICYLKTLKPINFNDVY